jgi:hypothetical protein
MTTLPAGLPPAQTKQRKPPAMPRQQQGWKFAGR